MTRVGGVISQSLDVPRKPTEDLLLDAVIDRPTTDIPQLFVFTGPAGAGKTIALKRAAWEAATSLEAICLWLLDGGALDDDVVLDFHRLTGERIFVFVDRLALRVDSVARLLAKAKQKRAPVTVIGSERLNEWNLFSESLQQVCQATELPIRNLSVSEIGILLDLLTRHKALGLLEGETRENQTIAFTERAERQLLVALHEATLGKPFEVIVHDEYLRIVPETARQLYLDICTMHQHNVSARAGAISRISGIQFEDFSQVFFAPLEKVVLTSTDPYTGDYQYRARHARIAQLVFQQARANDQDRADQLIRIVRSLDIGYAADQRALEGIIHGHSLARDIRQAGIAQTVFQAALETAPDSAFVLQQWAIFELNHSQGSIEEADALIRKALEREPRSNSVKHTHAVICRRRANSATSPLAKTQFRRLARERLDEMRARTDSYVLSLRSHIAIDELSDLADSLDDPPAESELAIFRDAVDKTENTVNRACELLPDDADLLQAVARLNILLRVRPETLCRITEFSEHESNGRELDEGERVAVEVLPVLGQSAAAVEPGDGAFDHPTPGLDDEALHPIGSLDDLGLEIGQDAGQGAVKDRPLIGAVGEQFPEKGKQTEQGRQQRETAVAILNVGGGDDAVQQQALRIDQNMPLLALDQLAGIEAVAVDASPPFSALFTL